MRRAEWTLLIALFVSPLFRGCGPYCPSIEEHCRAGRLLRLESGTYSGRLRPIPAGPNPGYHVAATVSFSRENPTSVTVAYGFEAYRIVEQWRVTSVQGCPAR